MVAVVVVALLAILLFGVGFTVHVLWWVAALLALVWLVGFVARPAGGRWYRW